MSPTRSVLRTFTATLALAQLVLLASCTGGTLAGKNGLSAPERTLVLADAALPGSIVGTPAIPEFVAQVTRRSHGKLKVEVRTRARDTDEQRRVIQRVAAGRVDLGWAEAHTFDTLGVTSLRPLLVPLLIDSYQLQAQVLRRHSAQLLADVPAKTGVIPLALLAGGLRFAAATDHPIVTAADWSGRAFSTTSPGSQEAGIRALGATPVIDPRDRQTLTQSGLIDSGESTWRAHPETLPYVAPNVRLWPRRRPAGQPPNLARPQSPTTRLAPRRGGQRRRLGRATRRRLRRDRATERLSVRKQGSAGQQHRARRDANRGAARDPTSTTTVMDRRARSRGECATRQSRKRPDRDHPRRVHIRRGRCAPSRRRTPWPPHRPRPDRRPATGDIPLLDDRGGHVQSQRRQGNSRVPTRKRRPVDLDHRQRSLVPRAETCGLDLPRGALQRLDLGISRCCHLHPDGERAARG
jgi:hypothetical protein